MKAYISIHHLRSGNMLYTVDEESADKEEAFKQFVELRNSINKLSPMECIILELEEGHAIFPAKLISECVLLLHLKEEEDKEG